MVGSKSSRMKPGKKSVQARKSRSSLTLHAKNQTRKIVPEHHRRLWIFGALDAGLFGMAFGVLSHDPFDSLWILSYEQAIVLGVTEMLVVSVLTVIFLWKIVVLWHDRPRSLKHVFDDPNLLA